MSDFKIEYEDDCTVWYWLEVDELYLYDGEYMYGETGLTSTCLEEERLGKTIDDDTFTWIGYLQ
jgi:hypothetical protein